MLVTPLPQAAPFFSQENGVEAVQLQKLNASHINRLYAQLLESGLSPSTVRRVHATLHRALRDATRWNKIVRNPSDQADPPKVSADESKEGADMSTWTADELRRFLRSVESDRLYPLWLLFATSGMRRGEALGLRLEDVDLTAGRVAVRQALIAVGYEVQISKPKRKRSRRSIPLDAGTMAALKAWKVRRAEERLAWGAAYQDCGLYFVRENGSLLHPDSISKAFDQLVRDSGLPRIRLHDLRHTFATLALQANLHPKVVAEILGHANVSITLDVYSHAIPSLEEEAAARVAALIFGAEPSR